MSGTSIRNENLSKPSFSSGLPAEEPALLDRAQQFYSNLTFNPDASFNPAGACIQTVAEAAAQAASETVRALFMGKVEIDGAAAASAYRRWSGVSNNRVLSTAAGLLGELLSVNFSILDSFLVKPTRNSIEGLVYGTAGMLNEKAPVENQWESTAAVLGVLSSLLMVASGVRVSNPASRSVWMRTEVARAEIQSHRMFTLPSVQGLKGLLPGSPGSGLLRSAPPPPPTIISRNQLAFVGGAGASTFYRSAFAGGSPLTIFNRGLVYAPADKGSGSGLSGPSPQSQIVKHIADLRNPNLSAQERINAAYDLGRMGDPGPILDLWTERPIIAVFAQALKDPKTRVYQAASKAFARRGDEQVVSALAQALKDPNYQVFQKAVVSLVRIGDKPALSALIGSFEKRGTEFDNIIFAALKGLENPEGISFLIDSLKGPNNSVSEFVAYVFSEMKKPELVPALIEALNDKNDFVRRSVSSALGNIGGQEAASALIKALQNKNELFDVRISMANALGQTRYQGAVPPLIKIFQDPSERLSVRTSVAYALGNIGGKTAYSALMEAFRDRENEVFSAAEYALRLIER